MKPASERLNERLELVGRRARTNRGSPDVQAWPSGALDSDPEVEQLVAVAMRWQNSPQLQADADFAGRLESRLLQRQALLRRTQPSRRFFPQLLRMHPVFSVTLALCLLILFLGSGVLVVAAQVSNPENPLYSVKNWEQQVQVSLANSPASKAALDVQFASERLRALTGLASPAQAEAYRQSLAEFEQQLNAAISTIRGLPPGPDRERLSNELANLESDARHSLQGLLPRLDLAERLLTTDALGQLGEAIPRLLRVEMVLPAHPNENATISVTGEDIQPGAQLLVNGQVIKAQSVFQGGAYVFTIGWSGNQQPHSIGVLNPDGMAVQTAAITMSSTGGSRQRNESGSSGSGESGQHGNSNGNSNGHGKPGKTPVPDPTPHH